MGLFSSVSNSFKRARRRARKIASAPKRVLRATQRGSLSERIGGVHKELVRNTPGGKYLEPALGFVMPATPFIKALGDEHGAPWPPATKEDKRKGRRRRRRLERRRRGGGAVGRPTSTPSPQASTLSAPLQREIDAEAAFLEVGRLTGIVEVDSSPPPKPRPPGLLTRFFRAFI